MKLSFIRGKLTSTISLDLHFQYRKILSADLNRSLHYSSSSFDKIEKTKLVFRDYKKEDYNAINLLNTTGYKELFSNGIKSNIKTLRFQAPIVLPSLGIACYFTLSIYPLLISSLSLYCTLLCSSLLYHKKQYDKLIDNELKDLTSPSICHEIYLNDDTNNQLIVCEVDEKIIACVAVSDVNEEEHGKIENALEIKRLVVDPEYRANGIAKKLVELSLNIIKSKGINLAVESIFEYNKKSIQLNSKMGFSIKGKAKNVAGLISWDVLLLEKYI